MEAAVAAASAQAITDAVLSQEALAFKYSTIELGELLEDGALQLAAKDAGTALSLLGDDFSSISEQYHANVAALVAVLAGTDGPARLKAVEAFLDSATGGGTGALLDMACIVLGRGGEAGS